MGFLKQFGIMLACLAIMGTLAILIEHTPRMKKVNANYQHIYGKNVSQSDWQDGKMQGLIDCNEVTQRSI